MQNFTANNKRTTKFIFLILFIGIVFGSIVTMILSFILPTGVVKDFFLMTQELGWQRTTLNLGAMKITTGFTFSISVCSLIGLFVSWYFLRYFK